MPIRMHGSPLSLSSVLNAASDNASKARDGPGPDRMESEHRQQQTGQLRYIHQRNQIASALSAALLLESIVPWDTELTEGIRSPDRDKQASTVEYLLSLHSRGGDTGLERWSKTFARADEDHDGRLNGREVITAAAAVRDDLKSREGALPPIVTSIALPSNALSAATSDFEELCAERLHAFTLLRLICPPEHALQGQARGFGRRNGSPSVLTIAAAAAASARGGPEDRQQAARQAVDDALSAEHVRVGQTVAQTGGVRLCPFLDAVLDLSKELQTARSKVAAIAEAQAEAEAKAARIELEAKQALLESSIAGQFARRRRERLSHEGATNELDRLLERLPNANAWPSVKLAEREAELADEVAGSTESVFQLLPRRLIGDFEDSDISGPSHVAAACTSTTATTKLSVPSRDLGAERGLYRNPISTSHACAEVKFEHLTSSWQPVVEIPFLREERMRAANNVTNIMRRSEFMSGFIDHL